MGKLALKREQDGRLGRISEEKKDLCCCLAKRKRPTHGGFFWFFLKCSETKWALMPWSDKVNSSISVSSGSEYFEILPCKALEYLKKLKKKFAAWQFLHAVLLEKVICEKVSFLLTEIFPTFAIFGYKLGKLNYILYQSTYY